MEETLTITCSFIVKGNVSGEALVSKDMFAFGGTPNLETGIVTEPEHELNGKDVTGKILVYPTGKGSTGDPYSFYFLWKAGHAPSAIINRTANPTTVVGSILCGIPMVHNCEKDPVSAIRNGDWVELDGEKGEIRITKKAKVAEYE